MKKLAEKRDMLDAQISCAAFFMNDEQDENGPHMEWILREIRAAFNRGLKLQLPPHLRWEEDRPLNVQAAAEASGRPEVLNGQIDHAVVLREIMNDIPDPQQDGVNGVVDVLLNERNPNPEVPMHGAPAPALEVVDRLSGRS